jgi:hypothetical protein
LDEILSPVSVISTIAATLPSGIIAALIAISADSWRNDRSRRRDGEIALQDFQRVLSDMSGYLLMRDSVIDETPLEQLDWEDLAQARRTAYPYRNLLHRDDQYLVARSSVPYDIYDDLPYDTRQPAVTQWAVDLASAIDRAFATKTQKVRRRFEKLRTG